MSLATLALRDAGELAESLVDGRLARGSFVRSSFISSTGASGEEEEEETFLCV
jgi:hypothetical protein